MAATVKDREDGGGRKQPLMGRFDVHVGSIINGHASETPVQVQQLGPNTSS